jgi:glucose-6-phosphate dehydrogenase assembly protein OpcA
VTSATVIAPASDPTAALMRGWLGSRLGHMPRLKATSEFPRMREVSLHCANGDNVSLTRDNDSAVLKRTGQIDRDLPLTRRPLGDELAEELRRLDADEIYAAALGAFAGMKKLNERAPTRVHIWQDPAVSEAPEAVTKPSARSKSAVAARSTKRRPTVSAKARASSTEAAGRTSGDGKAARR